MRKKGLSNEEFLGRVREYLPEENGICETDASGKCLHPIRLSDLEENTFYRFEADAALAFTHAIEDLALDDADGSLVAAMQNAAQFQPHRERYRQLTATLENVELIACGNLPRRKGGPKFRRDPGTIKNFWMTLYEGRKLQAMFLGEQANHADVFDEKTFIAFYTFNPRVISDARKEVAECLSGRRPRFRQFDRLHKLDRAAKHLRVEFDREKDTLDRAIRKLLSQRAKYRGKHFMTDLNKTLERLNRLQTHLPELIVDEQKND